MVEIARNVGVDRDTFYRYFNDTDWILFSLQERVLEESSGDVPSFEALLGVETPPDLIACFEFACIFPYADKLLGRHEEAAILRGCVEHIIALNLIRSLEAFLGEGGQRLALDFRISFEKIAIYIASGQVKLMIECSEIWRDPHVMASMSHKLRRAILLEVLPEEMLPSYKDLP